VPGSTLTDALCADSPLAMRALRQPQAVTRCCITACGVGECVLLWSRSGTSRMLQTAEQVRTMRHEERPTQSRAPRSQWEGELQVWTAPPPTMSSCSEHDLCMHEQGLCMLRRRTFQRRHEAPPRRHSTR
jgi:hypothetical protein